MKYGVDIGHNCTSDTGAVGIRREDDLTKEVGELVIYKLKNLGYEVIECKPEYCQSLGDSLSKRIEKAVVNEVDIFVSIHFNAGGGRGSEVYIADEKNRILAAKVLDELRKLGYLPRGVKLSKFYILRNLQCIAMHVECAFCDSIEDMKRYNAENIANAIIMGITDIDSVYLIPEKIQQHSPQKEVKYLQKFLNRLRIMDIDDNFLIEDGIMNTNTKTSLVKFKRIIGMEINDVYDSDVSNIMKLILSKPVVSSYYRHEMIIRYIQWRLGIKIDGIFSDVMRASIMIYQKQARLAPDGIVGVKTWDSLIGKDS